MSRPVYGKEFFNRIEEIETLKQNFGLIKAGDLRNVCLRGIRKSGKTSILFEFKERFSDKRIIMPYVYLLEETSVSFGRKFVQAILYETFIKNKKPAPDTVMDSIGQMIKLAPEMSDYLLRIRDSLNKKLTAENLELILELPEKLGETLGAIYWIQIDEFQRIKEINVPGIIDLFREKIIKQKNVCYLVAGSAIRLIHEIFDKEESPLFGHFEMITVGPFKYGDSREYVLKKLNGMIIPEILLNFMLNETGGYPYYLYALTDRITRDCRLKEINKEIIKEALVKEVYDPDGRIYTNIKELMEDSLGRRGLPRYHAVLKAIAREKYIVSEISEDVKIPMTELSTPLRKLFEVGFLKRDREGYKIANPMVLFYIKNVYLLDAKSFLSLDERYHRFKSQVEQMIGAFKTELGVAREAQIREIFFRMDKFDSVTNGDLLGHEFDLICKLKEKYWLGEIRIKAVDSAAIDHFHKKCNEIESVGKKMIFALFGIDKKAVLLAKDLGIEIWNLNKINREREKYKLSKISI